VRVGIVGCGPIAHSYVTAASRFAAIEFVACAGRTGQSASAREFAARHAIAAMSYGNMLQGDTVEAVLVLTPANDHFATASAAIAAGKHVYCEKPLATTLTDARDLVRLAAAHGVALGCAPDTVLGANVQTAAALLDQCALGRVLTGIAALGSPGMEHWHPAPDHLYQPGGGPVLDKGPYYVAALVTLLGAVETVQAQGTRSGAPRILTAPTAPRRNQPIPVAVDTTVAATLRFRSGALVTLVLSWDIAAHGLPDIELYGSAGSLRLDDPNWFGGTVRRHEDGIWAEYATCDHPLGLDNTRDVFGNSRADYRGVGLADMIAGIAAGRGPQCSGAFALHVIEVLTVIDDATLTGECHAVGMPERGFSLPRLSQAQAAAICLDG